MSHGYRPTGGSSFVKWVRDEGRYAPWSYPFSTSLTDDQLSVNRNLRKITRYRTASNGSGAEIADDILPIKSQSGAHHVRTKVETGMKKIKHTL